MWVKGLITMLSFFKDILNLTHLSVSSCVAKITLRLQLSGHGLPPECKTVMIIMSCIYAMP